MSIIFLNNDYIKEENAKISIFDRGFLFGDSVYETILIHKQTPFLLEKHLIRLAKNLKSINIALPNLPFSSIIKTLINKNTPDKNTLYIHITRGTDSTRRHNILPNLQPTVLICLLKSNYSNISPSLHLGVHVQTTEDTRWKNCHIKTTNLLPNILLYQEALSLGYQDVILHKNGILTEGIKSNLFLVKDNKIHTPICDHKIVNGITRALILKLISAQIISERNIMHQELYSADEVWLSNSTCDIVPVITINKKPIGSAQPGPLYSVVRTKLLKYMNEYTLNEPKHIETQ